jgi:glycosyltransferase involved in cell wall biosynthesis
MKRIAFLISDQHLIPHGGIGQFAKSFTEMMTKLGNVVDIISDKKPRNDFAYTLTNESVNLYYNSKPLSYANHTGWFMHSESINFEKISNFQTIMVTALELHKYDLIVVNSQEAQAGIAMMNIDTPVVLYTHLYKQIYPEATVKDVFLPCYHEYYNAILTMSHVTVGTQSEHNKQRLQENGVKHCVVLPMPMSERELLEPNYNERRGVLYIGRWEKGKNPEAFLRMIQQTGLPAKVLTNSNGAKKFVEAFAKIGHTDYEIKAGITGKEKNDFIRSCKVSYNTSLIENYPFAFIECLGHMPVVVLDSQIWSDNFDNRFYVKVNEKQAAEAVLEAYKTEPADRYATGSLDYVKALDDSASKLWSEFVTSSP